MNAVARAPTPRTDAVRQHVRHTAPISSDCVKGDSAGGRLKTYSAQGRTGRYSMSETDQLGAFIAVRRSVQEIAALADFRNAEPHAGLRGLLHLERKFRETPPKTNRPRELLPQPLGSRSWPGRRGHGSGDHFP